MLNRRLTFLTSALEALLAVAVTLGVLVVGLTLLWAVENNGTTDWIVAYRAAADIWLSAHGVGIGVAHQTIAGISTPAFLITVIPLGFTAVIISLAYRAGTRMASSQRLWPGWLATALVYGGFSLFVANSAVSPLASANPAQGTFQPPMIFLAVVMAASLLGKPGDNQGAPDSEGGERERIRRWLLARWESAGWWVNVVLPPALRAGSAIVVSLFAVSALAIAVQLAVNWIQVVSLYESLQLSLFGGLLLTLAQLIFLPNLVVYGVDWLIGPGFAIGAGSSVSPAGTSLGPLPSLPIFAAIPSETLAFGLTALAVPILAAALSTIMIRGHAERMRFEFANPIAAAASLGVPMALVAALEVMMLNLFASGSLGPGRLAEVGGNLWILGVTIFLEVAVVSTIAAFFSTKPEAPDQQLIARATQSIRQVNYSGGSGFEPEN